MLPLPEEGPSSERVFEGILQEVLYLQVQAAGTLSVLLDETLLEALGPPEQDLLLGALLTLGLDTLERDLSEVSEEVPLDRQLLGEDPTTALGIRFLLSEEGEFQLLVNFGLGLPPTWTLERALLHAHEALTTLKEATGA